MNDHLDECDEFNRKNKTKAQSSINSFLPPPISSSRKEALDLLLAQAMFTSGRSFTSFEDASWQVFFDSFGYKLPSADTFKTLLDQVYLKTKEEVREQIAGKRMAIVTDESTNITKNRMVNTSIVTPDGISYTWDTIEAKEGAQTTDRQFEDIVEAAHDITQGDLLRVTSLSTDTCNTNISLWTKANSDIRTRDWLMVPCDSHGIQLLIKDILMLPSIDHLWKQASTIVNGLRNAPKQYKFLQIEQFRQYGKRKALVASVITRWGTQYRLLKALLDSKRAITYFCANDDVDFGYKELLKTKDFWIQLEDLCEILSPIHELQRMSEDNKATLIYVYGRWRNIYNHLLNYSRTTSSFAAEISHHLHRTDKHIAKDEGLTWKERYARQVRNLHLVAHFIQPSTRNEHIDSASQDLIYHEFKQRFPANYQTIFTQWIAFRTQTGDFIMNEIQNDLQHKPQLFWAFHQQAGCPELARFASILLTTIANSVPSERAWSTMNFIHTKQRNRLAVNTLNKLMFIYINQRSLRKHAIPELDEDELLRLEDIAMGV
jgi:hypothetical protein